MKSITKKIVAASLVGVFVVVMIIAGVLLIPRTSGNSVDEIWYGAESFDMDKIASISKKPNKDFTIMAITDTQFDDPFKSKQQIKDDLLKMKNAINPDLIVTVGDNFAGIFNHFHVSAFTKMMDELGVPWAPIFGNHERDFGADLVYLAEQMQKSKTCLLKVGPTNIDGVGNYIVNVKEENKLICSLVMMDCNEEIIVKDANGKRVSAYYESPRHSQVEWYKDNISAIQKKVGTITPSILFTHTPLPEFRTAWELYSKNDSAVRYIEGEGEVGGGTINYGLFDAALALQSTKHMFFGHEHTNTLSLAYKGIQLSYAVKTGNFSSYTEGKTGATKIVIKDNGGIETKQIYSSELTT